MSLLARRVPLTTLASTCWPVAGCNANALHWLVCSRTYGTATGPYVTSRSTGSRSTSVREAVLEHPYSSVPGREGTTLVYGQTYAGRCLLVVALDEGGVAFIVTARDMTDAEKKTFRRKAR